MAKAKHISEKRYLRACRDYEGWCTKCRRFTRDCTEPDAEGYDCPCCGGMTVMGAEQALIEGEIEL